MDLSAVQVGWRRRRKRGEGKAGGDDWMMGVGNQFYAAFVVLTGKKSQLFFFFPGDSDKDNECKTGIVLSEKRTKIAFCSFCIIHEEAYYFCVQK